MYAIAPPLKPDDSGDQVANLQAALLFLLERDALKSFDPPRNPRADELKALTEGLRNEQAGQSFGPATQQLLVYLQLQEGLGAFLKGRVEETTAQRLNDWLVQLGAFYRVQGRVLEPASQTPVGGIRVQAFIEDAAGQKALGDGQSKPDGGFQIDASAAGAWPQPGSGASWGLVLRAIDDQGRVIGESRRVVGDATLVEIDVPFLGAIVEGRVIDTEGNPVAGLAVLVFELDARRLSGFVPWKSPVGSPVSQADGRFRCVFDPAPFLAGDEGYSPEPGFLPVPDGRGLATPNVQPRLPTGPDLWVTLQDRDERPPVAEIIFNTGWRTVVPDIVVPAEPRPALSELERVYWLVSPRQFKTSLRDLDEWNIAFLSKDCQCPIEWVRALVLGARWRYEALIWLSRRNRLVTDLSDEDRAFGSFVYAAARAMPDATLMQVLDRDPDVNVALLEQAVELVRVPAAVLQLRDALRGLLKDLRDGLWLAGSQGDEPSSLGDLIEIGWPNDPTMRDTLRTRAERLNRWRNDPATLKPGALDKLADDLGLDRGTAGRVHDILRLDFLSGRQPGMLQVLAGAPLKPGEPEPLLPLANLTALDWANLANVLAPRLRGGLAPDFYGRQLAARVQDLMPAPTLKRALQSEPAFQDRPVYAGLAAGLANLPALDLMEATPTILSKAVGLAEGSPALNALLGLRQLKAGGLDWEGAAHLVSVELTSFDDLVYLGPVLTRQRIDELPAGAVDPVAVEGLYNAALAHQSMAAAVVGWVSSASWTTELTVPTFGGGLPAEEQAISRQLGFDDCAPPGSLDVLSPAAYAADLNRFIEVSTRGLPQLEERLASARGLLLNSENTDIEKRVCDLAIEVLENAVALPRRLPLDVAAARQELSLNPVGSQLLEELRKTTDVPAGSFGPLAAEQELDPRRPRYGAENWLVSDAARHWRLRLSEEYWGPDSLSAEGVVLSAAQSAQVLAALTDAAPLADLARLGPLLPMLRRAFVTSSMPLGISRVEVRARGLSTSKLNQWTLDIDAEGVVEVETIPAGTWGRATNFSLTELTPPDTAQATDCLVRVTGGSRSIAVIDISSEAAVRARLAQRQFPSSLSVQLLGSNARLDPPSGTPPVYRYREGPRRLRIVHRPGGCELISLVYQSRPELDGASDEPVHRNPLAYEAMNAATASFPWSLPYDEPLAHARSLLNAAGASRREWIEAASNPLLRYTSLAWVQEVLGISSVEADQIAAALANDSIWLAWGLKGTSPALRVYDRVAKRFEQGPAWTASTPPSGLLQRVSIVMQQAELTFLELRAALATNYVNPNLAVRIVPDDVCDPAQMRLEGVPAGGDFYRRLHRFVRLQRALKWPAHELDVALRVATAAPAADFLGVLARIQALHERLGLAVEVVATFFLPDFPANPGLRVVPGDNVESLPPLYERLFASPQVGSALSRRLRFDRFQPPSATANAPAEPEHADTLEDLLPDLAAAFGVRERDVTALLTSDNPDLRGAGFARASRLRRGSGGLLALWRQLVLARALGLDEREYAAATRLMDTSPFRASTANGGPTAALLAFCDDIHLAVERGASFVELGHALLPPAGSAVPSVPDALTWPEPSEAARFLADLKATLASLAPPPRAQAVPLVLDLDPTAPPLPPDAPERWRRWGLKSLSSGNNWVTTFPVGIPPATLQGPPLQLLSRLDVLARQLGATQGQIRVMLETATVVVTDTLTFPTPSAGSPWLAVGLTEVHLDRLEWLAALHVASGLPVMELDQLLLAAQSMSKPVVLLQVAALGALLERTGLDPWLVVAWWSGFTGRRYDTDPGINPGTTNRVESMFDRAFSSSTVWRLNANRDALEAPPVRWTEAAARTELAQALRVDPELVVALERAGSLPSTVTLASLREVHRWVTLASALNLSVDRLVMHRALARAAIPDPFATPATLLDFLGRIDEERQAVDFVIAKTAAFAALPADMTEELLLNRITGETGPPPGSAMALLLRLRSAPAATAFLAETVISLREYSVLRKLRAFAWMNKGWRMEARHLAWLSSSAAQGFGGVNVDRVPVSPTDLALDFALWKKTSLLMRFAAADPVNASLLESYRQARLPELSSSSLDRSRGLLAAAFGCEPDQVAALAARVGAQPDAQRPSRDLDPQHLVPLLELLRMSQTLGLSAADLEHVVNAAPTPATVPAARRALLARHGAGSAERALADAAQVVRQGRLQRLVDYLVWHRDLGGPDDLYEYFGIDVQVSNCRKSTRMLQHAIATPQLYLQRCLLGDERASGITPEMFDRGRAEWMVSRVVRNANLEVFLFPWRYWLPELDPEKSTARENFERALSQGEATLANIELAIRRYVDELAETTRLKVIHLHLDGGAAGAQGAGETLYLLGRTRSAPYQFYWRRCVHYGTGSMRWTGWQKIEASIDGNWPKLFVHEGMLYVCWTQLADIGGSGGLPRYRVEVGCVRLINGRWADRKLSEPREFDGVLGLEADEQLSSDFAFLSTAPTLELYKAVTSSSFVPQAAERRESQSGPFWRGSPPTDGTALMTSILGSECVVSVRVNAWRKHTWTDPSTSNGSSKVHFERIGPWSVNVTVQITFRTTPQRYPDSYPKGARFDGVWNRHVARFAPIGQSEEKRITAVKITVGSGGASREFTFGEIDLANAEERLYAVDAVFESAQPPEQVSSARTALRYQALYEAVISDDGMPALSPASMGDVTPPTPLKRRGNWFVVEGPGRVGIDGGGAIDLQTNAGLAGIELRWASIGASAQFRGIAWAEKGEVAALIDANGEGLQLLPGPTPVPAAVRRDAAKDIESLFVAHQKQLAQQMAIPQSVTPLLPTNLTATRNPGNVPMAAFDRRFLQTSDHEELFLHVPWTAASEAAQQHRYDVTRRMLRLIFDPTQTTRWQYQPFANGAGLQTLSQLFAALTSPTDSPLKREAQAQVQEWLDNPFDPHAIVRMRPSEARKAVYVAYARNEFGLGDMNFRPFRQEPLNTAVMHYTTASKLLGPRPQRIASRAAPWKPRTYRQLASGQFGASSAGALLPTAGGNGVAVSAGAASASTQAVQQMLSLTTGYFRLPHDDALLALWDDIADRLYKVRNCQNIDGVEQEMPLLDPPIDPLLLIRARRSGLTIAEALSDAYAPPSHLRFETRLALAQEIVAAALPVVNAAWSTLEEAENEHLVAMRSDHELALLRLSNEIRDNEVKEAEENLRAMDQERTTLLDEVAYLARQLGGVPPMLDADGIPIVDDNLMVKIASPFKIGGNEVQSMGLSISERRQVEWLERSNNYALGASASRSAAKGFHVLATLDDKRKAVWTSAALGAEAIGELMGGLSGDASTWQKWNELIGGFERRHDQIKQEMRSKVSKLRELAKRKVAVTIRKSITEKNRANQLTQVEQLRKVHEYISRGKFSNEQTKLWAHRRARAMGYSFYRLAFEAAQQAEKAFQLSVGEQKRSFLEPGNWDSQYLGRFALEALSQSLLRIKSAYLSRPPELELTANLSLRHLNPFALIALRQLGSCEFDVTEDDLNRFQPSPLYFQRIRSLNLSIPCVVGPYTSIHAKLTVLANSFRHSGTVRGANANAPENFRTSYVPRPSLLTSSGQSDGGVFEFSLRSEHLLAGEGAGLAMCRFRLELPSGLQAFDYSTISDVVLQVRYTARDGGSALRTEMAARLGTASNLSLSQPAKAFVSIRTDFLSEWQRALSTNDEATVRLEAAHLPFWVAREAAKGRLALRRVESVVLSSAGLTTRELKPGVLDSQAAAFIPGATLALPCEVKLRNISASVQDHFLIMEFQ